MFAKQMKIKLQVERLYCCVQMEQVDNIDLLLVDIIDNLLMAVVSSWL